MTVMQPESSFEMGREPSTPTGQRMASPGGVRSPPLEGLDSHSERFQLDAFNKARSGSKGGLFGFGKAKTPGTPENLQLTMDDLLLFSEDEIPTSLLKHNPENGSRAIKMFASILQFMGVRGAQLGAVQQLELAQKLLHQGLKRSELRDELYMQLVKQTRGTPAAAAKLRAWQLLYLTAACMPPTKDFMGLVSEYVHTALHDEAEGEEVHAMAKKTWDAMKRTAKAGQRRTLPDMAEIDALFKSAKQTAVVYFLDETFEELHYDCSTTVAEAVAALAAQIKLENFSTFTLFAVHKGKALVEAGQPPADEHQLQDDNKFISDVIFDFKAVKAKDGGAMPRLLFKKKMFRETDETVTESMFVNLSYIQAQHDYLAGQYPVIREDAAQVCALQMHAESGPTLADDPSGFESALERYMVKQILMGRPREEWRTDVLSRYRALANFSKDEARTQFLRIIRSLPYGNSIFYSVKRIEDPIGLLPAKLILGINKRGVHFFRPVPKEYLHSAELRDIMQFGSSSSAVFFKMRVAGVLHIFQFESKQGEDICMALQTHINDIMEKRIIKAKAAAGDGGGGDLTSADFGPKYQAHVAELQRQLDEAVEAIADREKLINGLQSERQNLIDEVGVLKGMGGVSAGAAGAAGAAVAIDFAALNLTGSDAEKFEAIQGQLRTALGEKAVLEQKLVRLEEQHAAEVATLSKGGDAAKFQSSLKEKDAKINELVEDLGSKTVLLTEAQAQLANSGQERKELAELREMKEDVERRERAQAEVIESQKKRLDELDVLYRDEAVKRKKIYNQMEDMKGKIRVYCRVRPLMQFEKDRGNEMAVEIPDELSINLLGKDKKKEFSFDTVFTGGTTQERVFADTKHLIQSAVDGYNVCIFAYGQTGSGKTFTMNGNEAEPGLTPRGVTELFKILDRDAAKASFKVEVFMLELYIDDLQDLLAENKKGERAFKQPKLEIKKDTKGVVTVPGAVVVEVTSARELMATIEGGLHRRQVSSTKMNSESSRSHLVVTICIESTNLQTQSVSRGKLSFVDLAGSERVKKSGSAGDQLKEAQAINKSLSALGNVIAALASEQAHVPYRDHKLTMLMSDSIGGTAKTLMFVNVSPVDYNLDETANSLTYATRVSTIKNDVTKNDSNKDVIKLKKMVDYWKEQAGLPAHKRDYVDLVEIEDKVQNDN